MNLGLDQKLAVVTGSTAGIGRGIAARLAAEGAKVVVNGRTRERAEQTAREISASGRAYAVPADLSTAEGVATLVKGARKLGPIDILVNNFGIFEPKPFVEISDDDRCSPPSGWGRGGYVLLRDWDILKTSVPVKLPRSHRVNKTIFNKSHAIMNPDSTL